MSDTESEGEVSELKYTVPSSKLCRKKTGASLADEADSAVEVLCSIDMQAVKHDMDLHGHIQDASTAILDFLDNVIEANSKLCEENASLAVIMKIFDPFFLSLLFDYREAFYKIAIEALAPGTVASVISCWVDHILAKLGESVVTLAGGTAAVTEHQKSLNTLKRQLEDDNVRASTQLPRKWNEVPGVIISPCASPAAKRLALRLTFAVHVILPELAPELSCPIPLGLTAGLQVFFDGGPSQDACDEFLSEPVDSRNIANHAMMISLFVSGDFAIQSSASRTALPPFRPHTLSHILRAIGHIMHPNSTASTVDLTSPCDHLSVSQTVLIAWGKIIPWCWKVWGDHGFSQMASVTYMTVTWLYHLETSFERCLEYSEVWATALKSYLTDHSAAIEPFILQILQSYTSVLRSPRLSSKSLNILFKTCYATEQLLSPEITSDKTLQSPVLSKCLFHIFICLGNSPEEMHVKGLVLKNLTFMSTKALQLGFEQLLEDNGTRIATMFDEEISRSTQIQDKSIPSVKLLLDFLMVLWHNRIRWCFQSQTITSFFDSIFEWLSQEDSSSPSTVTLFGSFLNALATLEKSRLETILKDVKWKTETLWILVLTRPLNIVVASGFAQYILATKDRPAPGALTCAEAWEYLRDCLLLIFSHRISESSEALAPAICSAAAQALLCLLEKADTRIVTFVLTSPWTISLCSELIKLIDDEFPHTQYLSVLQGQLSLVGKVLLNEINRRLHPDIVCTRLSIAVNRRPVFCYIHGIPHILLVSECQRPSEI